MKIDKRIVKGLNFTLALFTFITFVYFVIKQLPSSNFSFSFLEPYKNLIIKGWFNSIFVSLVSLLCSLIIGFIIYIMMINNILFFRYFIRYLGVIFNEIIFGSPLLVFVLIIYYFVGTAFNYENRMVLGIGAISFYMAPYMTNLFKGAIESIDKDQHMAAKIFGFTTIQKYRYIILPQIIKIILPPLTGNLTFIIKGSALLQIIGYRELFYTISTAQSRTYAFTEGYILMMILYLSITIPLIRLTTYLERRYIK